MFELSLLYFLLLVIVIVIDYFVAKAFEEIAEEKGFSNHSKYFWFSFWLGPIGHLMTVALPDKKARMIAAASLLEEEEKKPTEEIPEELKF